MNRRKYGFLKTSIDAHTLGINSAMSLLSECGEIVCKINSELEECVSHYIKGESQPKIINWIVKEKITHLGISYRLDPKDAINLVDSLMSDLNVYSLFGEANSQVEYICFAGLPKACQIIEEKWKSKIVVFSGGEDPLQTLSKMRIKNECIPNYFFESSKYDMYLNEFARLIIDSKKYNEISGFDNVCNYAEFGTDKDSIEKRLENRLDKTIPLIRAHVGPYDSGISREASIEVFLDWINELKNKKLLDILSIGSSQLTQEKFGENWENFSNGGGVPIQNEAEYVRVWDESRPLLVRTYSGTKNVEILARVHEKNLNICWHAFSFWWFNKLDQRGPNDLMTNLKQHFSAVKYAAKTNKPIEANVSHHFSFRGGDDLTYILSAYFSAKLAKLTGVRTFILQNMLNTPRLTFGIQDLVKSRVLLKIIKSLEDSEFKVIFQPRAGLDYFKPDINTAKIQLAAITALMDDIVPTDNESPDIIHVVSYSEAVDLATPDIINESIKITKYSLQEYRKYKKKNCFFTDKTKIEVDNLVCNLFNSVRKHIDVIENEVKDIYTEEGFYKIFLCGFLRAPQVWTDFPEFMSLKDWDTRVVNGRVCVVDEFGIEMCDDDIIKKAIENMNRIVSI